jgi:hypothetical protein
MTRMGTITRVGDAYSYGSVEVANAWKRLTNID